jgi:predicted RNA-binding Zn ribbon-like protein
MGDWVWEGGRVSVDLLNTVRDRAETPRETLLTPADLALWLSEAGLPTDAETGADDLATARRLRAAIDRLAFPSEPADAPGDAVEVINAVAAHAPGGPRLAWADGRLVASPPPATVTGALARVALDAVDLLTGDERLRVCEAHDCGIRFADRSPAGNRQWCSMRRCGNRMKARRHHARTRA